MQRKNRGGAWGAGIGLLATLIVVAIGLWLWSTMVETVAIQPGPATMNVLDSVTEKKAAWDQRSKNMERDLGLTPPTPASTPASQTAP